MIDPQKKTIVFDFGNVLINLDFEKGYRYFERILEVDWKDRELPDSILNAMFKYERGQIKDESLIWTFQQFNDKVNPREIIKAWNSILEDLPLGRMDMLKELRQDYNLAVLSNINNLHITAIYDYFEKELDLHDFEDHFDAIFYSHIIGMRKPDDEIYSHVSETLNSKPSDLLFIDDMVPNVEAAKKNGWNAIHHNPKNDIRDVIDSYLREVNFK